MQEPLVVHAFFKGLTKISSTHLPLFLPNFPILVAHIFFRLDPQSLLSSYWYIYREPYMRAQPLYLSKFEYSPALIFLKFSVLIISALIKKLCIRRNHAYVYTTLLESNRCQMASLPTVALVVRWSKALLWQS